MSAREPALFVWGISHRKTPLALRERCLIDGEGWRALSAHLRGQGLSQCVLLATCNRVEIYAEGAFNPLALAGIVSQACGLDPRALDEFFYCEHGAGAVAHLMRVAAGLDSQLVGETEILGQTKDAYACAVADGTTGALLNRLFQKSFQAAKWARSATGISRGQVSVGNVAVDLAERIFGELGQARVLVLGAGEVGEKVLQAMRSRGAEKITLASRTLGHAVLTSQKIGGAFAATLDDALEKLPAFDIVVGSLADSPAFLDGETVARALERRKCEPMFFIDLAVPRNFGDFTLADAYLYRLEDLARIADEHLKTRLAEVDHCRKALEERALRLWQSLCQRA